VDASLKLLLDARSGQTHHSDTAATVAAAARLDDMPGWVRSGRSRASPLLDDLDLTVGELEDLIAADT